ncbi:Ergosterol biosynthesis ERG4/ERG24 family domain containing protein [Naviculisporaceae sp. PSN 640]
MLGTSGTISWRRGACNTNGDMLIWGRTGAGRSWLGSLLASTPVVLAPLASITTFTALHAFGGSFSAYSAAVAEEGFWTVCMKYGPQLTWEGVAAVAYWVAFQALLSLYLPGDIRKGQVTPAGHALTYKLNGLSSWILTHLVYFGLSWLGVIDPAFIAKNWSSLIAAMNLAGLLSPALAFVKAYLSPTHPDDRKFSNSSIYDFYMGIELNPRIGPDFDLKLFGNGHLGMMVWTFIDYSFIAYQYQTRNGHIEPALILLTILQVLYVGDFFINEEWYLGTIDIAHDHYGFYLAWGCFCFLPTTYTIQAQYLGMFPPSRAASSNVYLAVVFLLGLTGYILFRSINDQRHHARLLGEKCRIWGKPAEFIKAEYTTTDGERRQSLLLCSGWWGMSRHANYTADLLLSYCSCALVGTTKVVVWTYAIWMTICLVHRCIRDENRLSAKYGPAWEEYCRRVPWRFLPAVEKISSTVRQFYSQEKAYRVYHGSSNSTRPSHDATKENIVDISMLNNVVKVDVQKRIALVEPNVPMDKLVEATLPFGLVPPVVMEFPGITVGGGFSGTSGESSSFRHGFFDETVEGVEIVLGNGDVVRAGRSGGDANKEDLFHGAASAVGTLGIVTLVELRLVEAREFVKVTYRRVGSVRDAVAEIHKLAGADSPDVDYIDGILYSKGHGVVVTGQLVDTKPEEYPIRTFSHPWDQWYYMHVQDTTGQLADGETVVEYVPLGEYLFRYDRGGFWVGRQGYTYFKDYIPFTRFCRWLLDDYSHTRTLYHALHASGVASQFVVQDLALPYNAAEDFVDWVDQELGIWPLWLCPLRGGYPLPTFHPVTESQNGEETVSQPMLNIGVWGWGPADRTTFLAKNRALEAKLVELRGRKWLYAHTYYTEDEFWGEYGHRETYDRLRKKYFAGTLPSVYDKVKPKPAKSQDKGLKKTQPSQSSWGAGSRRDYSSWLSAWPVGGLYGMVRATLSGDIKLHRRAKWRYRGE